MEREGHGRVRTVSRVPEAGTDAWLRVSPGGPALWGRGCGSSASHHSGLEGKRCLNRIRISSFGKHPCCEALQTPHIRKAMKCTVLTRTVHTATATCGCRAPRTPGRVRAQGGWLQQPHVVTTARGAAAGERCLTDCCSSLSKQRVLEPFHIPSAL